MHPPKAYDPAQRSDAAEYQRDCVEVRHIKFVASCENYFELGTLMPSLAFPKHVMSRDMS